MVGYEVVVNYFMVLSLNMPWRGGGEETLKNCSQDNQYYG
jgi:hypothetical protein